MTKKTESGSPLAVVGTVAIDAVETPFGKRDSVFGGSAAYFSYASSFFTPVSLVAVVGEDFPAEYRAVLEERPIDLSHLEIKPGKTFHWKGNYGSDMNVANTLDTQLNVLADFNPKVSFAQHPSVLFLANIDPMLQMSILDQLDASKLRYVACDTMNFWIGSKREELLKVLPRINCLVVNDGEARLLTGESNLMQAARKIRAMGPEHIVIKKGEHGVLLFYGDQFAALPAFPLDSVFDPTGAGDTFAAGMIGYLTQTQDTSFENMKRAIATGSIVASFTVEDFGLERLRRLTRENIAERLDLFRKISTF